MDHETIQDDLAYMVSFKNDKTKVIKDDMGHIDFVKVTKTLDHVFDFQFMYLITNLSVT